MNTIQTSLVSNLHNVILNQIVRNVIKKEGKELLNPFLRKSKGNTSPILVGNNK